MWRVNVQLAAGHDTHIMFHFLAAYKEWEVSAAGLCHVKTYRGMETKGIDLPFFLCFGVSIFESPEFFAANRVFVKAQTTAQRPEKTPISQTA